MRKNKKVVSLNPEYGIEVTTLAQLADKAKDDNPELCTILTILTASISLFCYLLQYSFHSYLV